MKRRERQVVRLDQEERNLESIEQMLEDDVRYYWRRTREMAGHESWSFYENFESDTWCGCDCNHWNRQALLRAIDRLRAWRDGQDVPRQFWG